ncbi:hypothetical protein BC828DRAFT_415535 [Blastocladiella britannica]|nr:hypothetical protein BC828DRAFT_415535 [Blastocladiella britannica]
MNDLNGSSSTPEDAPSVLDVLLKHRAPPVLTVVLARGFRDNDPILAVKESRPPSRQQTRSGANAARVTTTGSAACGRAFRLWARDQTGSDTSREV